MGVMRDVDLGLADMISDVGTYGVYILVERALKEIDPEKVGAATIVELPKPTDGDEGDATTEDSDTPKKVTVNGDSEQTSKEETEDEKTAREEAEKRALEARTRPAKPHLLDYYNWMKSFAATKRGLPLPEQCQTEEDLLKLVRDSSIDGKLLNKIGSRLVDIVENRLEPLELMFADSTLVDFYRDSQTLVQLNNCESKDLMT